MLLKFGRTNGFLYSFDALICAGVLVSVLGGLTIVQGAEFSLSDELLFQAGQDALEVCSKEGDLSRVCLERVIRRLNPSVKLFEDCGETGVLFERHYFSDFVLRLRICY